MRRPRKAIKPEDPKRLARRLARQADYPDPESLHRLASQLVHRGLKRPQ